MVYTTNESHSTASIKFVGTLYDTLLSDFLHTTLQSTQNFYVRMTD